MHLWHHHYKRCHKPNHPLVIHSFPPSFFVCIGVMRTFSIRSTPCILFPPALLPQWLSCKESACNTRAIGDVGSIPGLGRSPEGGRGNPLTPVFLPGESHRQRSLVGYNPQDHRVRQDWTTFTLAFHTYLDLTHDSVIQLPMPGSFLFLWFGPG